jgi:cell division protein FtsB
MGRGIAGDEMRFLMIVLVAVLTLLQARLWISNGGLREVWRLEAEVARRADDNRRLAARNSALEAEVLDLKQGLAAAEERARTELGMIQAGETFYQIAPAVPPRQR